MRKTLWACVAASALSLAFTATSFAAVNYGENNANLFTYDETANTITITGNLTACGEDATVLVLKPLTNDSITDDDILYITQEKAADKETKLAGLGLKGESLAKDTTYTVKVGGTNITSADAILVGTFEVKDSTTPKTVTVIWGDVNNDGTADYKDAGAILARAIGGPAKVGESEYTINTVFVNDLVWGDVNKDATADYKDAGAILARAIGGPAKVGESEYTINTEAVITVAE